MRRRYRRSCIGTLLDLIIGTALFMVLIFMGLFFFTIFM